MRLLLVFLFFLSLALWACELSRNSEEEKKQFERSKKLAQKQLKSIQVRKTDNVLHLPLPKPKYGEWLTNHAESGQTYQAYFYSNPIRVSPKRSKIYILPLGDFDKKERKLLTITAEYLEVFFDIEVVIEAPESVDIIPNKAMRRLDTDAPQIWTKYILYDILLTKLPRDALAYMALTNYDLYPYSDWNFVFGQANIKKRVGVSSIYRLKGKNFYSSEKGFLKTLKRILKTASHESGHMLSIKHCTAYHCAMNGSNHLEEADKKPMHLCPECVAKVSWNTSYPLRKRYQNLARFFEKYNLKTEENFCRNSIKILQNMKQVTRKAWSDEVARQSLIVWAKKVLEEND